MAYAMRGRETKSHVSIAADAATTRWVFAHVAFAAVAPRPPHNSAQPLHKEREEEKEKIPHTPLREKEEGKETTGSVSGSRVRVRVGADTFFDPTLDPVSVAVAVFGGDRNDRRLWRWYLYRIGEDTFRQLAFTQWRENRSDGMPDKPPACFQCKLTAALKAQSAAETKGGAR